MVGFLRLPKRRYSRAVSSAPRLGVAAAAMVLACAAATAGSSEPELIDRIIAVVEDEAIFKSDVDQLVKQYMFQQGTSSLSDSVRIRLFQNFLQELINDKLVIAQAGRLDITVPFSEVEERVDQAVADNSRALGGEEAFQRQLEREGFTIESLKKLYREQISSRMLVQRVLEMEVKRSDLEISDSDLRSFYQERNSQLPQRPAVVHLRTIFVGFDSADRAKLNAKARIDELHRQLRVGEPFEDLAKAHSEDPSAPLGGDLGFVSPGDLADPAFAQTAASLEVGEISEPVLTTYGYHILQVTEKNPDNGEVRLRHIMVRLSASDDDIQQVYVKANDIHKRVIAGESFQELADEYNTDPTATEGGDLGWLRVADLPEFFQDVLAGMKPGDVSQVLRESAGFRLVKVIERENERPYEYEEIKAELRRIYEQDMLEVAYTEYIKTLREKFVVEFR